MTESDEQLKLLDQADQVAETDNDEDEVSGGQVHPSYGRFTSSLALASFAATVGGSFITGYNLVAMNTPEMFILAFMNQSLSRYVAQPSQTSLTVVWSVSVSIFVLSGALGAFTFGFIADRVGRRNGLFVCQVGSIVSSIFFAIAVPTNLFELLIVGRVLVGWSAGACAGLVPLYLTEIAPLNLRGVAGCLNQLGVVSGALVGQFLGLSFLLGTASRWPALLALTSLPNLISFALLPFCPESPGFLLIERQDEAEAEKALRRLRARKDVAAELLQIRREGDLQKSSGKWSLVRLLSTSALRLPLALICAANAAQQLSGINAIICYSQQIFTSENIPASDSQYAVLGTGAVRAITVLIAIIFIEKAGRRLLLLLSSGGVTILCVMICISLVFASTASWLAYMSITLVIIFVVVYAVGLDCIPQFLGAELFPLGPRAPAMSLAVLTNWLLSFTVVITFPLMQLSLGGYSFLIFAFLGSVFFVFLFLKLPETKQKSISEIYEQL